ncbi:McrC family protein [Mycobacterium sp. SMC-13]|uniref:McrC family protein n=1 Tax=Mycobacterium sp. SMC-13 TaxID=3381626 RepID=UPI0038766607
MFQTIELVEYESRRVRATRGPTTADLELAARLSAGGDLDPRLEIRWLASGDLEVRASSWIGVARFSSVEIRVVPKLAGGTLRVLRMLEYTAGVRLLAHLPIDRQLPADGTDLFELVVMLLIEETRQLLRDGLIRDYRPVDDTLDVMRGRLRIRDQFLRRYGTLHRLECHFDEYDGDVVENQLLAAAFAAASPRVRDPDVRLNAQSLASLLAGICVPRTRDPDWYARRIVYGRLNDRYRPAHELAVLVLNGLALRDLFDTSSGRVTAFMLNMNVVFERFVTRLVDDALAGSRLRASAQTSYRAVILDENTGQNYSTIRPDLVITDTETGLTVPVDIKYKLYDSRKFGPGDIYQLFLYAYALGDDESPRVAGLIYPTTASTSGPVLHIAPHAGAVGARIRGAGLNLPATLDALAESSTESVHASVRAMIETITGLAAAIA